MIIIIFGAYFIFQAIKNFQLHTINTGLKNKDSELVEKTADMKMSRKLLGEYVCDLYKLRAYYVTKKVDKFEATLDHMIQTEYRRPDDKKSFLETYFHTFLIKGNRKYAARLLEGIRETGDLKFIRCSEQCYEVMMDERNDLIDDMVEDINSKAYYGFSLGAILYMVAIQYSRLGDRQNAELYMQSAKACFHPKAVYMPAVNRFLMQTAE